jgi:uncharacterized membrane protein YbhN (UPF0104 family)
VGLLQRVLAPRTIASLAVAAGLLSFSLWRLGPETLQQTWAQIRSLNPAYYLAALGVYYLAFPVRAVRWRILLENAGADAAEIPRRRVLAETIYLSWFANSLTPAKLGDVYRGWLLRRTSGISWSLGMGTIVAERLLDMMVLAGLMAASGLLAYRSIVSRGPVTESEAAAGAQLGPILVQILVAGAIALPVLVLGLVVFARYGAHLERWLPSRLGEIYVRFSGGLVYSFGRFGPLLVLSSAAWACEAGRFYFVGRSLGHVLPLHLVLFFSLVSAFLTIIPVTPGGVGFEFLLAATLRLFGYPPAEVWSLLLVDRSLSYLSLVLGGAAVYAWSPRTK